MEIRICHSSANLRYYLERAGNHYLDDATVRFFRSREVATIGNGSRAVSIETMGRGFARSAGRMYKATLFTIADGGNYTITATSETVYHGDDDGAPSMATQRKRAFAAAYNAINPAIA